MTSRQPPNPRDVLKSLLARSIGIEHKLIEAGKERRDIEIRFADELDSRRAATMIKDLMPYLDLSYNFDQAQIRVVGTRSAEELLSQFGGTFHKDFMVDWPAAAKDSIPERFVDAHGCVKNPYELSQWLTTDEARRTVPNYVKREDTRRAADEALDALKQNLAAVASRN